MKAIVVKEIGSFEYMDVPRPEPGPGEVLVEVAVTGLCRTDLKLIEVGHRDLSLPRIPAEEVVGTVCQTGDTSMAGQLVYIYPGTSCGACGPCRSGAGNLCRSMEIMGFHRDGGFAEYVTAPTASLIPVPDGLSEDEAVFAEPLSCCLNALELAHLKAGDTIAIWGGGPAGTLLARAAEAVGTLPTVIETDERRRDLLGGCTQVLDQQFDVAIVAVGLHEPYTIAIQHLAPRGRLVVFSGLPRNDPAISVNLNQLHYNEQTVVGAYGCSYRHGKQALDLIAEGKVKVRDMISHRFELKDLNKALDIVRERSGMKILLYPPSPSKEQCDE